MWSSCPLAADEITQCLPSWLKVCNFENCRIKLHNLIQAYNLGIC